MPIYTTTLPQLTEEIIAVKLENLINALPETIPFSINVWICDKIVQYGISINNQVFLTEQEDEPSVEQKQYFNSLVTSLGIQATLMNQWCDKNYNAMQVYRLGELMIDKDTLTYKILPAKRSELPILKAEDVMAKLPQEIEWKNTIYMTGGLVRNGWSANDADFMILDTTVDNSILLEIRNYLNQILKWKVHVGKYIMHDREPVYLYKLYEDGKLCQQ
jgi:hypothetical protein